MGAETLAERIVHLGISLKEKYHYSLKQHKLLLLDIVRNFATAHKSALFFHCAVRG